MYSSSANQPVRLPGAARILLESCIDSLDAAVASERAGVRRIELCANLDVGGTTPGAAGGARNLRPWGEAGGVLWGRGPIAGVPLTTPANSSYRLAVGGAVEIALDGRPKTVARDDDAVRVGMIVDVDIAWIKAGVWDPLYPPGGWGVRCEDGPGVRCAASVVGLVRSTTTPWSCFAAATVVHSSGPGSS